MSASAGGGGHFFLSRNMSASTSPIQMGSSIVGGVALSDPAYEEWLRAQYAQQFGADAYQRDIIGMKFAQCGTVRRCREILSTGIQKLFGTRAIPPQEGDGPTHAVLARHR